MRKKVNYLVMATVFMLLVGISEINAQDYFIPLHVGQTFTYRVTDGIGNTCKEVFYVSGTTNVPSIGKNYFLFDVMLKYQGVAFDDPEKHIFRSSLKKVFIYDGFGVERIAWQNAPVGTTWSYVEFDGDIKEYTIEAIETVTVPAGIFTGCLKIRKRCINCPGSADWIEWVKPGFFMVKWVDYWTDNPPVTYELLKWTE